MEQFLYYFQLVILSASIYLLLKACNQFLERSQILQEKTRDFLFCSIELQVHRPKSKDSLLKILTTFHNTGIAYLDFRHFCQQKILEFLLVSMSIGVFGYYWLGIPLFIVFVSVYFFFTKRSKSIVDNLRKLIDEIVREHPEMNLPKFEFTATNLNP